MAVSTDEAEGDLLIGARRMAHPALESMGATLLDDVAVPIGRRAELLDGIPGIAAAHDVTIGTFGHAGDGNLHPTIVYPHGDPDAVRRARAAFTDIIHFALSLGGTVTGEDGVGPLKRDLLGAELGSTLDLHRAIKHALDPNNLLNPGKAL